MTGLCATEIENSYYREVLSYIIGYIGKLNAFLVGIFWMQESIGYV